MCNAFFKSLGIAALFCLPPLAVTSCTTTQSVKEQSSDSRIAAEVKAKLTADRFSNLMNIEINCTNGVVTLAGEVPNEETRREAEREARSVDGVRDVNNNLQVNVHR